MNNVTQILQYSLLTHPFFKHLLFAIAFTFLCSIAYERALKGQRVEMEQLAMQLRNLKHEKVIATAHHEALLLQLNSESDPQWIELTLMKKLGVVPEDYTKVFFTQK